MNEYLELFAAVIDDIDDEDVKARLARAAAADADLHEARERRMVALEERIAALERQLRPPGRVESALAGGRKPS